MSKKTSVPSRSHEVSHHLLMSVPQDAEHTNTYILTPILTNPYYP